MRWITRTSVVALAVATLSAQAPVQQVVAAPGDNPVVHWNEIALDTIMADGSRSTPSAASLYVAITQAAVYDAVMAIEGTNEPYAFTGYAAPGASVDAAVAAAAHDVLSHYFPTQKASRLDPAYDAALADVPDGASETDGVSVGQRSALEIIARRAHDGRDALAPAPDAFDGTGPGEWRRTNPSGAPVTPYVANVTPFLAESPDQFRPKGPHKLTSKRYAEEFERTRIYGGKADTALTDVQRDPAQDEVATFWTENTVRQYNRALRGLANERGLSTADSALLFAMTTIPAADAMITCWNTKYHYLAWRPITAIRLADTDGNPLTTADPAWEPLSLTANHPEYVSGHACLTGAISRGLEEFLGTKQIDLSITFVSSGVTVYTHDFARVDDLRSEVEDARVYGGDHWTTGGTDGTGLGDDLAKWALKRYFEEI
ncbi:MAG TPA: vanadium-dependent haloperoxidase [Actinomycetota bacterium]